MLRLILRHTHNALLFACILLLLCSFERLWRYDFAQIQLTSPTTQATTLEEGLQVDHFVFWGGIPAWERSLEAKNPVKVGLSKFMSWAGDWHHHYHLKPPSVIPPAIEAAEEFLLNTPPAVKTVVQTAATATAANTATPQPLIEAKLVMKRQIRHNKKRHHQRRSRSKEDIIVSHEQQPQPQPQPPHGSELIAGEGTEVEGADKQEEGTKDNETSAAAAGEGKNETKEAAATSTTTPSPPPQPKIGFVLYLPSCDREAIGSWQKVWTEQALDQPFLFNILLGATVEDESCAPVLQAELENTNDDMVIYRVEARNDRTALALQTCRNDPSENILEGLDEFLYYDVSKAVGRIRSSPSMRRFQRRTDAPSVFECAGGQQKPAFCDDSVLDCPWFQYSPPPPPGTEEETTTREAEPELPAITE